MNKWVLVSGDFKYTGGMDRANLELAKYLAREDRVDLVGHHCDGELARSRNVTFHPVSRPFGKHFLGRPFLNWGGRKVAARLTQDGSRVIVNGGNCNWGDINWVHYVNAAYETEAQAGKLSGIKNTLNSIYSLNSERKALQSARLVICNSIKTKNDLSKYLDIRPEVMKVVYLGSDMGAHEIATAAEKTSLRKTFGWDESRPVVIFIGGLGDKRKGFDLVYSAWTEMRKSKVVDPVLVVVGSGSNLSYWKKLVSDAGMENSILFLGYRSDVPNLLKAADLMVAPSRYEPYGLGVHEAICAGVPAIVSKSSGVAEKYPIQLQDLVVEDASDARKFADLIQHFILNLEKCRNEMLPFSKELRDRTWEVVSKEMRDVMMAS